MKAFAELSERELDEIRREAIDFAGIGLYRYGFDGIVQFMDRGALRILDLEERYPDPDMVRGMDIADLIIYTGPRGFLRSQVLEHGHARNLEYPFRTVTGEDRWALHDTYLVTDDATGEKLIQVIIRDITQRKLAESALAEEKERLAVTLRSIGDGVITTDIAGRVVLLNKSAEKLTAWSQQDAAGTPLAEVFHIINEKTRVRCENPVEKVLETGGVVGLANSTVLIARDGTERIIADSGAPIRNEKSEIVGVVLVFRDVTDQVRVEAELQRVERLSSLGVMAGGIAHDFNNFLMGILGSLSMIQSISTEAQVQDLVVEGENAAMRARELTNQLLTFAKGGLPIRKPISITRLLRETIGFTLRGSKVGYTLAAPDDVWLVDIDEGQIGQVIGNLVINADQAMPGGGTIRIECRNHAVVEGNSLPLAPGRYVEVAIIDEGTGIPDGLLPRIFDPFFTTKQKGSGLGLSTSFSIVKKHDGHITVSSVLGEGSTFTVFLPASGVRPSSQPAAVAPPPSSRRVKVLVMDDDPTVREVVGHMLTALGSVVDVVRDGAEAIERVRDARLAGEQYDVVFLDLTVPGGMGGIEAVARIREIDGSVKVVASSGYSTDAVMSDFRAHGFDAALPKPYNMKMLKELLATVLGGG